MCDSAIRSVEISVIILLSEETFLVTLNKLQGGMFLGRIEGRLMTKYYYACRDKFKYVLVILQSHSGWIAHLSTKVRRSAIFSSVLPATKCPIYPSGRTKMMAFSGIYFDLASSLNRNM